jgi:DNA-binding CsgD family transcriptional regulator
MSASTARTDKPAWDGELPDVVGRTEELSRIADFVTGREPGTQVLVLDGAPGVGKTTLWEAGVGLARKKGMRVLTARSSGAETALCFAAVVDLFDDVSLDDLVSLPQPQRRALGVALLRADPGDEPAGPHAIGLGLLAALRELAGESGLLVGLDDAQWIDAGSAEVLAFALRRPGAARVRVLHARRGGEVPDWQRGLVPDQATRVEVGAQSLGATGQLLAHRLGLRLSRHDLRQVHELTQGNPLFALAVGRTIMEQQATGDHLPVPRDVEELLGMRLSARPPAVRRLLLALALDGDLRADDLRRLSGDDVLTEAVGSGLVVVERDRVRPAHPLLAAAARSLATEPEVDALHLELADVLGDQQQCAVHVALGSRDPDDDKSAIVSSAAGRAGARGATREAAVLAGHALRLTPETAAQWPERVLELADRLRIVGDKTEMTTLVTDSLDPSWTPAQQVRGHLLLTSGDIEHSDDVRHHLDRALAAAGDDSTLQAPVLARMVDNEAVVRVQNVPQAHEWALQGVAAALDRADQRMLVRHALAWTQALQGHPVDVPTDSSDTGDLVHTWTPDRIAGQRLVWRGEVDKARTVLTQLLRTADEQGAPWAYAIQRLHLCELELRTGRWTAAGELLDEWADSLDSRLLHWPMYERCRALAAAGTGLVDEARRWADEAISRADATGVRWDRFEAQRARGSVALLRHDPAAAVPDLLPVWEHCQEHGIHDPGVFPVAPDLVEALVETGDLDSAAEVTERLRVLGVEQDHPWAQVTAQRAAATVRLASGTTDERARVELLDVADRLGSLDLPYDAGRSLLTLGRAMRRARRWGAAREALDAAVAGFDDLGSIGWAADARAELSRVGARKPSTDGELTATERRVAELAASGLANKEIAAALVVTVNTVEFHLRNTYAKLAIRSRSQLAGRLPAPGPEGPRPQHPDLPTLGSTS